MSQDLFLVVIVVLNLIYTYGAITLFDKNLLFTEQIKGYFASIFFGFLSSLMWFKVIETYFNISNNTLLILMIPIFWINVLSIYYIGRKKIDEGAIYQIRLFGLFLIKSNEQEEIEMPFILQDEWIWNPLVTIKNIETER